MQLLLHEAEVRGPELVEVWQNRYILRDENDVLVDDKFSTVLASSEFFQAYGNPSSPTGKFWGQCKADFWDVNAKIPVGGARLRHLL